MDIEIFLPEANSFHPIIRFTAEVSKEEHVYLDTMVRLVGNEIDMDLYAKHKDKHQFLLPQFFTRNTAAEMFRVIWH